MLILLLVGFVFILHVLKTTDTRYGHVTREGDLWEIAFIKALKKALLFSKQAPPLHVANIVSPDGSALPSFYYFCYQNTAAYFTKRNLAKTTADQMMAWCYSLVAMRTIRG